MKIILPSPAQDTIEAMVQALNTALKNLRRLRREEQHSIEISKPLTPNSFWSAAIASLIRQYQKEGYLLQTEGENILEHCLLLEEEKKGIDFEKIGIIPNALGRRKDIRNAIYYMLGELIDNIFDHARAPVALLTAQARANRFSFAVADTGISIPGAFRVANVPIQDDCDALRKVLEGLSTKTVEERGTGLPTTRQLIGQAFQGVLHILSGGGILVAKGNIQCSPLPFYWQGTVVCAEGTVPVEEINFYEIIGQP